MARTSSGLTKETTKKTSIFNVKRFTDSIIIKNKLKLTPLNFEHSNSC